MSDVAIEPVGPKKKVFSPEFFPLYEEKHYVPFSPSVVIEEAKSQKNVDMRPKLTSPSRVGSSSMSNLISLVNNLDNLKNNLQDESRLKILNYSKLHKSLHHDLKEAQKAHEEVEQKGKFTALLKDLALFTTSTISFLYTGRWRESSLTEKILKTSTVGVSGLSLATHVLDRFNIVDEKVKNILLGLNLLGLGASSYMHFTAMAQLATPVEKFSNMASQIISGASLIDEGHRNNQSALLTKKAFEQNREIKAIESRLTDTFNEDLYDRQRLEIERQVASIIHAYQDASRGIQDNYQG